MALSRETKRIYICELDSYAAWLGKPSNIKDIMKTFDWAYLCYAGTLKRSIVEIKMHFKATCRYEYVDMRDGGIEKLVNQIAEDIKELNDPELEIHVIKPMDKYLEDFERVFDKKYYFKMESNETIRVGRYSQRKARANKEIKTEKDEKIAEVVDEFGGQIAVGIPVGEKQNKKQERSGSGKGGGVAGAVASEEATVVIAEPTTKEPIQSSPASQEQAVTGKQDVSESNRQEDPRKQGAVPVEEETKKKDLQQKAASVNFGNANPRPTNPPMGWEPTRNQRPTQRSQSRGPQGKDQGEPRVSRNNKETIYDVETEIFHTNHIRPMPDRVYSKFANDRAKYIESMEMALCASINKVLPSFKQAGYSNAEYKKLIDVLIGSYGYDDFCLSWRVTAPSILLSDMTRNEYEALKPEADHYSEVCELAYNGDVWHR